MRKRIFYVAILVFMLFSCKAPRKVEREIITTELTTSLVKYDSVYVLDSIIIPYFYLDKGEGVTQKIDIPTKEKYRKETKYVTIHSDSLRIDTFIKRIEVPISVPAKISFFQNLQMYVGNASIIFLVIFLVVKYKSKILSLILKLK